MTDAPSIDRESIIPYYHQLKVILAEQIRQGFLRPDDPLPSESELCKVYGVSRATVRRALAELANEGLLYSVRGKGSFVAKPKLEQSLFRFYALGRDLRSRGLALESRTLSQRATALPPEAATRLRQPPRAPAAQILRVRLLDGAPLALERSMVVGEAVGALLSADLSQASIYDIVEEALGGRVIKAEEYLEPAILDEFEAELLECSEGLPAFRIERLAYMEESRPFEWRISVIRGDRFRFYTELR